VINLFVKVLIPTERHCGYALFLFLSTVTKKCVVGHAVVSVFYFSYQFYLIDLCNNIVRRGKIEHCYRDIDNELCFTPVSDTIKRLLTKGEVQIHNCIHYSLSNTNFRWLVDTERKEFLHHLGLEH